MNTNQQNISTARMLALAGATLCLTAIGAGAATHVIGNDARPVVTEGKITTGAYNDVTGTFVSDVRHFGYQLGTSPGNPYFTADPGFNAVVGSGLPVGQQLRFNLQRKLVRWDGAGAVNFADISTGESLRFQFGAASSTATATSAFVSGFSLGNIGSGGAIHRHLNAFLEGPAAPTTGLYMTVLRLNVSNGAVGQSGAIYLAYNNGLSAPDFERGMDYLANPIAGDTNFDSRVNFDDLLTLAQNYATNTDAAWYEGDFNRDANVNFDDLLLLAQSYGAGSLVGGSSFEAGFAADWAYAQSLVPEPMTLLPLVTLVMQRRGPRRMT